MNTYRRLLSRFCAVAAFTAMMLTFAAPASAQPCRTCEPTDPTPPPAPAKVTVTGTFKYEDRSSNGGSSLDVPIANAKVEIWRLRPRQPMGITLWGRDVTTTTNAQGNISVQLDYIQPGITYAVRVFATNNAAKVWPEQLVRTESFWQEPGQQEGGAIQRVVTFPNTTVDFSHTFRDRWIAQHFNVAETLRIGRAYFDARRTDTDPLDVVNVSISEWNAPSYTFYNPLVPEIVLGISGDEFGAFRDDIILHEYGHHVLDQISATSLTPASHGPCQLTDPESAWQEGAAEFIPSAVRRVNSQPWLRVDGLPEATPLCPGPGENVEAFITSALWDLVDPLGPGIMYEDFDRLSDMDGAFVRIIDSGMDNGQNGTMYGFRAAWQHAQFDLAALDSILVANKIDFTS